MNDLALHTGADIIFENNYLIHQPTVFELSEYFSEDEFFKTLQTLGIESMGDIDSFHIFFGLFFSEFLPEQDRTLIIQFLALLFGNYSVFLSEKGFVVKKDEKDDGLLLSEENFSKFQEIIKKMFAWDKIFNGNKKEEDYNPANDKAREIAEKLKKRHEALARARSKDNDGKSFFGNYLSIVSIGLGENMTDLSKKLTFFQLLKEVERIGMKEGFDQLLKIKTSFVTASSSKEPLEDWMKFI